MGNISSAIGSSRLGVFENIISNQFDHIDLSAIMVYLVDVVSPDALPWLAEQFDIEGFKGFDRCRTDKQKRELIKNAIMLHGNIGTISAIRKACSIIGYTPKAIEENVPLTTGGENVWCAFRIRMLPEDLSGFDSDTLSLLKQYISYYKNARSILAEIFFDVDFEDKISPISDSLSIIGTINTVGDFSLDFGYDFY